jgi:branched-chain amino acid transport system permease protein
MVSILVFAFASATLGGLDSIGGVVLGAALIGLLQSMLGSYVRQIGNELSLTAAFVVMMIVLLVRPTGIFGAKTMDRV